MRVLVSKRKDKSLQNERVREGAVGANFGGNGLSASLQLQARGGNDHG